MLLLLLLTWRMDLGIIHHLEQQQHIGLLQLSSLGVALNNTTKHTHERERLSIVGIE
jgi:hypothetical protein